MKTAKEYFRERLSNLLEERDIPQYRLAEYLNATRQSISQYVNGKTTPDYDTLVKISNFFDVPVDYLLGGMSVLTLEEDRYRKQLEEQGVDGDCFDSTIHEYRKISDMRNRLISLYSNKLDAISNGSLWGLFVQEQLSLIRKYESICDLFSYSEEKIGQPKTGEINPEYVQDRLFELENEPYFKNQNKNSAIIFELLRMSKIL